ncbi:M16 family metallopeptidase [Sphingomonas sp. MMS24-JH45]
MAGTALAGVVLPVAVAAQQAAPVSTLVRAVDIPYQEFTLKNGLRVVVHTDRKAPVVAVSIWYDVGSKHEPKGKTGFAHLFEHLMFNGSENAPGDFFEPLKQVGATDFKNSTTYFDRTNYFETVPTAALERALFLEIGPHGLPHRRDHAGRARQAARRRPEREAAGRHQTGLGLVRYKLTEGLFPASHPYGHTTIGSMADLDAASLADVKDWFRSHYGPNNAVLVLAGDVDVPTATRLVEKYFGGIPAGRRASRRPRRCRPRCRAGERGDEGPRRRAAGAEDLGRAGTQRQGCRRARRRGEGILGGLASSRFDDVLVKKEKIAVQVSASYSDFAQVGTFTINAIARPDVDPALVAKRLDEVVAEFLRTGPTADEVQRFVTQSVSQRIAGLESVGGFGGKAVALAEGALYSDDPGFYKKQLADLAAQTPASVKAAADRWLSRPGYSLTVVPGARDAYQDAAVPPARPVAAAPEPAAKGNRGPLPRSATSPG